MNNLLTCHCWLSSASSLRLSQWHGSNSSNSSSSSIASAAGSTGGGLAVDAATVFAEALVSLSVMMVVVIILGKCECIPFGA